MEPNPNPSPPPPLQRPPPLTQPATATTTTTTTITKPNNPQRDFLLHLESYLSKRDGVDKLLKISRYTSKLILSSSLLPPHALPFTRRLKSFESNLGLSRKAFRLGKFIQDINALRSASQKSTTTQHLILSFIAYGGEGIYYFVEQFIWLSKSGLISPHHARRLQKVSAWAELLGYVGSLSLKVRDLQELNEKLRCLRSTNEIGNLRGENCDEVKLMEDGVRKKIVMKKMSILQDLMDGLMAMADVRDDNGILSAPFVLSFAGLLSGLISMHKNWVSC